MTEHEQTEVASARTAATEKIPRGAKSFLALAVLGGLAIAGGMALSNGIETPEVFVDAGPSLAEQILVADDLAPQVALKTASGKLARNETLIELITDLGASHDDAYSALNTLFDDDLIDPRRLQSGISADISLTGEGSLEAISIRPETGRTVFAVRNSKGEFTAANLLVAEQIRTKRITGAIETSLYVDALKNGAKDQQVVDFASIFAYDIDFPARHPPGRYLRDFV